MRYRADFQPTGIHAPIGRGFLHVEETGLVIDGSFPQFYIPAWFAKWFRKVICAPSLRTIPYASIARYKKAGGMHYLQYRLPDGKKRKLRFYLAGAREVRDRFSAEIEQGRTVARTYLQT